MSDLVNKADGRLVGPALGEIMVAALTVRDKGFRMEHVADAEKRIHRLTNHYTDGQITWHDLHKAFTATLLECLVIVDPKNK